MILVTGRSLKLDGICFLANTDAPCEAFLMLASAWNKNTTTQMRIVGSGNDCYLLRTDCEYDEVHSFEDGIPRREGYLLEAIDLKEGVIVKDMPW